LGIDIVVSVFDSKSALIVIRNFALQGGACPSIDTLESWQLLGYIKQVNFDPPGSENEVRF